MTCTGADVGLLNGKHGQTIDAIQYLPNAMARSQAGQHEVVVDAAGYRARRTATLKTLAKRTAQRASATGRRVELEPMTPVERKIVHEVGLKVIEIILRDRLVERARTAGARLRMGSSRFRTGSNASVTCAAEG